MTLNSSKILGLTGGIATGKSTVSKIINEKGYPIIDGDLISREVVEIDKPAYKDIVNTFGGEVLHQDRSLNREKLGEIIFQDSGSRKKLNTIVHGRVYERIREYIAKYKKERINLIFIDLPLLVEVMEDLKNENIVFDEIWLVYASREHQISRLKKRNNYTTEEALMRINSQMPIEDKKKYCDRIIDNTKDIKYTIEQIERAIYQITLK